MTEGVSNIYLILEVLASVQSSSSAKSHTEINQPSIITNKTIHTFEAQVSGLASFLSELDYK